MVKHFICVEKAGCLEPGPACSQEQGHGRGPQPVPRTPGGLPVLPLEWSLRSSRDPLSTDAHVLSGQRQLREPLDTVLSVEARADRHAQSRCCLPVGALCFLRLLKIQSMSLGLPES